MNISEETLDFVVNVFDFILGLDKLTDESKEILEHMKCSEDFERKILEELSEVSDIGAVMREKLNFYFQQYCHGG